MTSPAALNNLSAIIQVFFGRKRYVNKVDHIITDTYNIFLYHHIRYIISLTRLIAGIFSVSKAQSMLKLVGFTKLKRVTLLVGWLTVSALISIFR